MKKDLFLSQKPVLLFDGVCNLCNDSVQFIIRRDPASRIVFASLQSGAGQQILNNNNILSPRFTPTTIILITGGKHYIKSEAALRTLRILGGFYGFISWPLSWIPIGLRDRIYELVARNRYKWFGRQKSCMLPNPQLKTRFLQEPSENF